MSFPEQETVYVEIVAITAKAYCVKDTDDEEVWLPTSQIEVQSATFKNGKRFASITLPLWLAKEKGLI